MKKSLVLVSLATLICFEVNGMTSAERKAANKAAAGKPQAATLAPATTKPASTGTVTTVAELMETYPSSVADIARAAIDSATPMANGGSNTSAAYKAAMAIMG